VLKHHLAKFESNTTETPMSIVQENRILLKLVKDFNAIISQEIDKNLPKIQVKVDFLHPESNPFKTLDSDLLNNCKILQTLKEELQKLTIRKEEITYRHYFLELKNQVDETKTTIKKFKQEIHRFGFEIQQDGKKLNEIENFCQGIPESLIKCQKIEEEMAVNEVKVKSLREKTQENQRFTQENEKKEREAQENLEEITKKANEMGINLENEGLERRYRGLKRKIGQLEKDNEFLKKRNEKINEIWSKEMEDIRSVLENRESRSEMVEKGIAIESEIIEKLNEKGEFDDEIYNKINSLKEFGGVALLGDRIMNRYDSKNISFIEETRKKLAGNLSFISNKAENEKKKYVNSSLELSKKEDFLKKEIKEMNDDLKESSRFNGKESKNESLQEDLNRKKIGLLNKNKNNIIYQEDFEKVQEKIENVKEIEPVVKGNPFKFNFKKGKNSESDTLLYNNNNNSSKNESFIDKKKEPNENDPSDIKTYNFKKTKEIGGLYKSMDGELQQQKPELKKETTQDNNNKNTFFEVKKESEPVLKTFNFGRTKENADINKFNNDINLEKQKELEIKNDHNNETIINKSATFNKSKQINENDQENINKTSVNTITEQPNNGKTFNFMKNKDNSNLRLPSENPQINNIQQLPSNSNQIQDAKLNSIEKPKDFNNNDPQIINNPTQTKRPRNIFNINENEEKTSQFGKIMEIPEIKDSQEIKDSNQETKNPFKEIKEVEKGELLKENNKKTPSWLMDNAEEKPIENVVQPKTLKKKIQDPFESNKIEEDFDFGEKKEEKKGLSLNINKKESEKTNFNHNNDFFKDFDL